MKNNKLASSISFMLLVLGLTLTACAPSAPNTTDAAATKAPALETQAPPPAPANPELILATTTSTRDSGLLELLIPKFEAASGYIVKVVAVGTGQALKMGEEGNADVLLVHSPKAELDLMDKGFGKDRVLVMHNDFIIVGPAADPAGIAGSPTAVEAFQKIQTGGSIFVSRADDSGTHKMELNLWRLAEVTPGSEAYLETGQGMGDTLRIASEKGAYTLTDRATYLALSSTLDLKVLVEGDKALLNIYHVITVNPDKWPAVNYEGAKAFSDFLVAPETQAIIGQYGVEQYGQPLFFPDAGKAEDEVGK